eukprot:5253962-Prorocentrum_lima.AAC.1
MSSPPTEGGPSYPAEVNGAGLPTVPPDTDSLDDVDIGLAPPANLHQPVPSEVPWQQPLSPTSPGYEAWPQPHTGAILPPATHWQP